MARDQAETVAADADAQRKRAWLFGFLALGGLLVVLTALWVGSYLASAPEQALTAGRAELIALIEELRLVALAFTLGAWLIACLAGLFMLAHGRRVLAAGRYPYPGMTVLYDTRLRTGSAARRRGLTAVGLGLAMLAAATASAGYAYYTVEAELARARQEINSARIP